MSHFTVLVIGDTPEEQLMPYQENNMGDCPGEFLEFNETETENKEEYENDFTEKVIMPDGRKLNKWDNEFRVQGAMGIGSGTHEVPENLEIQKIPFTELYATFEEYMEKWCSYDERDEKMGLYGYWENPNAKWDWFQLGGRWTGFFELKPGSTWSSNKSLGEPGLMTAPAKCGQADQARKGEIDWESMMKKAGEEADKTYTKFIEVTKDIELPKRWEEIRESMFPGDIQAAREYYNAHPFVQAVRKADLDPFMDETLDYYCVNNGGRETFVANQMANSISTFAVLKDGKWYEKGSMGWWGLVSDEKEQNKWNEEYLKLIQNLPDDTLVSVYDCHI